MYTSQSIVTLQFLKSRKYLSLSTFLPCTLFLSFLIHAHMGRIRLSLLKFPPVYSHSMLSLALSPLPATLQQTLSRALQSSLLYFYLLPFYSVPSSLKPPLFLKPCQPPFSSVSIVLYTCILLSIYVCPSEFDLTFFSGSPPFYIFTMPT